MASEDQRDIQGCTICFLIFTTMLLAAAAIILLILLISWGNVGFIGSPSITLGTCTQTYFTTKYSSIAQINQLVFVGSCITAFISTILLLVMIAWTCKVCKKQKVTKVSNSAAYVFICINILAAIPPSGYYLSFLLQINKCSSSVMDVTQTITIFLLAAAVLILSIMILFTIACLASKGEYDQINTSQTEPNQQRRQVENKQEQQPPLIKIKEEYTRQKINYTRQNVYDSPSKRKIIKDIQPTEKPIYRKYQPSKKYYLNPKENVVQNLHPSLKGIDPRDYVQANYGEDQDRFKQYQKKYYDNDRRGILSRIQPQEKYREEQPRYRKNPSPQRQYDRNYRSPNRNRNERQEYDDREYGYPPRDRRQRQAYPDRQYRDRQPYRRNNRDQYDSWGRDNRNREGILARKYRY